jgi:hypothetical protein
MMEELYVLEEILEEASATRYQMLPKKSKLRYHKELKKNIFHHKELQKFTSE